MKITTLETAEKVPFNLDGRKMYTGEKAELIHLNLNSNEEVGLHSNPFDVVFYILEGEGLVNIEGDSILVKANNSIFIEKDKQRGMTNTGSKYLKVLVFKIF
jgi:mannose-6-phosphate isomerase-like protein (cupin superfamily)